VCATGRGVVYPGGSDWRYSSSSQWSTHTHTIKRHCQGNRVGLGVEIDVLLLDGYSTYHVGASNCQMVWCPMNLTAIMHTDSATAELQLSRSQGTHGNCIVQDCRVLKGTQGIQGKLKGHMVITETGGSVLVPQCMTCNSMCGEG
jgi:hypothetical protein